MKARCWFLFVVALSLSACNGSQTQTPVLADIPASGAEASVASFVVQLLSASSIPVSIYQKAATTAVAAAGAFEDNRPVVARVNHQPIFLDSFERQVNRFEQFLTTEGVDLSSQAGHEKLAQIRRQVLETLIDQLLIEQQAQKLNISITEAMLKTKIDESIARGQGQAQFEQWLMINHLTFEEFAAILRSELIANQVFEAVTKEITEDSSKKQFFVAWLAQQRASAQIVRYVAL
jgi:parvulin-like peptidyl-prolyl isomerase